MDLKLTEEEKLIQQTAAQFVQKELLARENAYLKQAELFLPPGDPARRDLDRETRRTLTKLAQEAGLWALDIADNDEQSGTSTLAKALIHREFGRSILPFQPACIPSLMSRSPYAKPLGEGTLSLALAFDQIHKTGTLRSIEIRFRETADGYNLSNSEIEVDPSADLYLLPAREEGSERAGLFLIERSSSGISIGESEDLTTDSTVARLTLNYCKLRREQLLGYEYDVAALIAAEQLRIAARCLGIATRCISDSIEHARNRVTFGRPLASRQAIQWMLADLSLSLQSSTWLTLAAAWRADHELPFFRAAALAKRKAASTAFQAADTAIQIHGGYGVAKEFPFEGFYREARMLRLLYGREAEIDRVIGERFIQEGSRQ
jgi:acyl-CoA dehydrogenase